MAKVPEEFHEFFWEVNAGKLDTERNPEYIIERILEHGTLDGVKWMRRTFGDKKIKEYIKTQGHRSLSSRTINFWQVIYRFKPEECIPISSMSNKFSFWKY